MHIYLLSVSRRAPDWLTTGFMDYARRLPRCCQLHLIEVPPVVRHKGLSREHCLEQEGQRLLRALPSSELLCIALAVQGQSWTTATLANHLQQWLQTGRQVAFLIGGADGLAPSCLQRAEQQWSLSPLTFPHVLVRLVIAEQIYRAWSLLQGHPYHRE
jgi:23S rRNA (pseudouridine1915-N3)-methyltransferase